MMRASSASGFSIDIAFDAPASVPVPAPAPTASNKRPAKWPVAMCAVFAMVAACAAFTESPLGQRPEVRPYTNAIHVAVVDGWHRSVSRVRGMH